MELRDLARSVFAEGIDGVKCVGIWQGQAFYARTRDDRFWEYTDRWAESDNGRVVHVNLKNWLDKEKGTW